MVANLLDRNSTVHKCLEVSASKALKYPIRVVPLRLPQRAARKWCGPQTLHLIHKEANHSEDVIIEFDSKQPCFCGGEDISHEAADNLRRKISSRFE